MSRLLAGFAALLLLLLLGCGGGGGGGGTSGNTNAGGVTVEGRVVDVFTGLAVSPATAVEIGGATATTDNSGDFSVSAPRSATTINLPSTPYGVRSFTFPAAASTDDLIDVGDLYIGPQSVTVTGTVRDAQSGDAIVGAVVSFGGRRAVSNASGSFSIADVAYSTQNSSGFFGITGQAVATGYITGTFGASAEASNGIVAIGDVRLVTSGETTPPDGPYNLTGLVSGVNAGETVTVELLQNGGVVRTAPRRTDNRFYFWIEPGTYTVRATGSVSGVASTSVTVTATNVIVTQNVTLP